MSTATRRSLISSRDQRRYDAAAREQGLAVLQQRRRDSVVRSALDSVAAPAAASGGSSNKRGSMGVLESMVDALASADTPLPPEPLPPPVLSRSRPRLAALPLRPSTVVPSEPRSPPRVATAARLPVGLTSFDLAPVPVPKSHHPYRASTAVPQPRRGEGSDAGGHGVDSSGSGGSAGGGVDEAQPPADRHNNASGAFPARPRRRTVRVLPSLAKHASVEPPVMGVSSHHRRRSRSRTRKPSRVAQPARTMSPPPAPHPGLLSPVMHLACRSPTLSPTATTGGAVVSVDVAAVASSPPLGVTPSSRAQTSPAALALPAPVLGARAPRGGTLHAERSDSPVGWRVLRRAVTRLVAHAGGKPHRRMVTVAQPVDVGPAAGSNDPSVPALSVSVYDSKRCVGRTAYVTHAALDAAPQAVVHSLSDGSLQAVVELAFHDVRNVLHATPAPSATWTMLRRGVVKLQQGNGRRTRRLVSVQARHSPPDQEVSVTLYNSDATDGQQVFLSPQEVAAAPTTFTAGLTAGSLMPVVEHAFRHLRPAVGLPGSDAVPSPAAVRVAGPPPTAAAAPLGDSSDAPTAAGSGWRVVRRGAARVAGRPGGPLRPCLVTVSKRVAKPLFESLTPHTAVYHVATHSTSSSMGFAAHLSEADVDMAPPGVRDGLADGPLQPLVEFALMLVATPRGAGVAASPHASASHQRPASDEPRAADGLPTLANSRYTVGLLTNARRFIASARVDASGVSVQLRVYNLSDGTSHSGSLPLALLPAVLGLGPHARMCTDDLGRLLHHHLMMCGDDGRTAHGVGVGAGAGSGTAAGEGAADTGATAARAGPERGAGAGAGAAAVAAARRVPGLPLAPGDDAGFPFAFVRHVCNASVPAGAAGVMALSGWVVVAPAWSEPVVAVTGALRSGPATADVFGGASVPAHVPVGGVDAAVGAALAASVLVDGLAGRVELGPLSV